jgi:putative flippase GtrA
MLDANRARELLRFGITGLLCLLVNLGGMTLLTELVGLHYLTSLAFSSATSATVGFVINRWWTFRIHGTSIAPEYLRYVITSGAQVIAGLWSCAWLVDGLHMPYVPAVLIVSGLLAPLSYLAHRAWSFGLAWLRQRPAQ